MRGWSLRVVLGALCVAVVTSSVGLSAAGASTQHVTKHHHHRHHKSTNLVKHKAKKKPPVTTCAGFGKFRYLSEYPQTDARSESRGLVPAIDRLDCSAADHATIDIKSWFIRVDDPTIARIVGHLALMSRYHHVRVNVSIGSNAYTAKQMAAFRKSFSFAYIYTCPRSCFAATGTSISHSKWITVSRLRLQNVSAVLSTSANWTKEQFTGTRQTGILTVGHPALYTAFLHRFWIYESCALHGACTHARPALRWAGSPGAWVYFAPGAPGVGDPVSETLDRVQCTPGSFIDVTSLVLTRTAIIRRLTALRQKGCAVRVILEEPVTASLSTGLAPRCEMNHDKSMLIETANVHEAIAGSEDFGGGGIYNNDNQMVMTSNATTRSVFESFFNSNWSAAKTCKVVAGGMAQLRKMPED